MIDVEIRWRGETLAIRRILRAGVIAAGDVPGSIAPIPCEQLGARGIEIARSDGHTTQARVPAGVVATLRRADGATALVAGPATPLLEAGESLEYPIGDFFVGVASIAPEIGERPAPRRVAPGAAPHVALAALVHLLLLGASAHARSPEDADDAREGVMRDLLVSAEQRAAARDAVIHDGLVDIEGRAGGATRQKGEAGSMGDPRAQSRERRRQATPRAASEPAFGREEALRDAAEFGVIGILGRGSAAPVSAWSRVEASGADALAARGDLWARQAGSYESSGGLELSGVGDGGGGRGGALGGSAAPSRWASSSWDGSWGWGGYYGRSSRIQRSKPALRVRLTIGVEGALDHDVVRRVVRSQLGRFRQCFEAGHKKDPSLSGAVDVRFLISHDGRLVFALDSGSSITDRAIPSCVERSFTGLSFPEPREGIARGTAHLTFEVERPREE